MARPVLYPLRSVDTAAVRYVRCPRGRRRITIDHRPLAGVTPTMLLDWFTHLGGTMRYGEQIVDRYHAWHPIDHIRWELARPASGGGVAEGARFHMVEALGARPEFTVDEVARVEARRHRHPTGAAHRGHPGVPAGAHLVGGADGAHYVTVMDLGVRSRLLWPINRMLQRRFSDEKARAWVKHNIEEVGQLEYLLPTLHPSGEPEPAACRQRGHRAPDGEHREAEPVH